MKTSLTTIQKMCWLYSLTLLLFGLSFFIPLHVSSFKDTAICLNQMQMERKLQSMNLYLPEIGEEKLQQSKQLKRRNNLSIKPDQLRTLIRETLEAIIPDMNSPEAIELLMMTSAQESHCGRYIEQVGGIALGIFQMEPATYKDLFVNYLSYQSKIEMVLNANFKVHMDNFRVNLMGNIPYQIVIARLQYRRFPKSLPSHNDPHAMACYYKKYWNTHLGKATVPEALFNYDKYAF